MNDTMMMKLRGLIITAGGFTLIQISNLKDIVLMIALGSVVIGITASLLIKQIKG